MVDSPSSSRLLTMAALLPPPMDAGAGTAVAGFAPAIAHAYTTVLLRSFALKLQKLCVATSERQQQQQPQPAAIAAAKF